MSDNFAEDGEKDREGNRESNGSKDKAHNQMPGFSGNLYQSKWLMWYLLKGLSSKQYQFELGTEVEEAGKYDDLVFKYKKVIDGNERDRFIIMQSKHKTNTNKKITYQDVLTDGNVDLGLVKYFDSFIESKNAKMFKDGEIEHAIIYTNARFDMEGKIPEKDYNWKELKNFRNITEEMKLKQDDTLSAFKIKGGKFYRFKSDLVLPVLKSMILEYEYYKIAHKLINALKHENKYLSLDDNVLKRYNQLLLTEVIDKDSKMFLGDFLYKNCDGDEYDTGQKKLRRALDKVLKDEGLKIEEIAEKAFKWRRNFEKSGKLIQIWPAVIDDTDLKEFMKKSVFAVEQPDEIKLGKIILDELRKQTNNPIYDEELIHSYFAIEIHNWMKGGNFSNNKSKNISKSRFISFEDANNFFENTIRKFNKMLLKEPMADYDYHIQKYKINFVDLEFNRAIKAFLDSDRRILSIISKQTMMSSIKLYIELKKTNELIQFIYIKLSSSNNRSLNSAIQTFESESIDRLLVIEWSRDETKLDDWTDKISNIIDAIRSHEQNKLIIVSNRNDILEKYFRNDFFIDTECLEKQDNENSLENLEKDSQDSFLNMMVKFQGKDAKLRDFIRNDDLKKVIDGDILQKILKKEEINIGKQIEGLKADMQHCYVDRTFMRKVENDENVYLISEINEGELGSEYQNYKIIEKYEPSTEKEIPKPQNFDTDVNININIKKYKYWKRKIESFNSLVDENKSKNVYLLRKESNELVLLRKSKQSLKESNFRNAIKCEHDKCEIILISAIAGSGKSTLLTKLSQTIKDQNPKLWVVKIDLNTMSSKLREIQNKNPVNIQLETVIDLLHYGVKHQNELEKTIFEHRLQGKNVVLLLDGFDEICPSYKSIVLKIIQILENKAAIKTIWISTRPYDSILIDMKKTFANFYVKLYNFEPLTEDSQKEYLKNIWQYYIKVDKEFFELFVKELFKLFSNNMKGEFLGVPLHIMLIGVTFKDTFVEFQNASKSEISTEQQQKLLEMLNLSSLYDKFVKFKCQIHFEDKCSLNLDTEVGKGIFNELYRQCLKKNKVLALDSLLDENELKILLTKTESKKVKEYKVEIEEKGDAFGIANQIVDGKPQFIHRTFAEYFMAMFFIENLKRKDKESQKIAEYFLKNMINDEKSVICDFIDSKLNDEPNFMEYSDSDKYGNVVMKIEEGKLYYILERRWQNIGEIFIKNGIDMNYDCNEKTILYPASKLERLNGKKPILSLIFEKVNYKKKQLKSELLKTDGFTSSTPLLCAAMNGRLENIKIILEICKTMDIFDDILFNKSECGENIIHVTVIHNDIFFLNILNLLISEPVKLKALLTKKNSDGLTPFDKAVFFGQQNNFETMWNLCEELDISTDSVLFNQTENSENILHLVAYSFSKIDFFTYLMNLLKSESGKLKALLTKKNIHSYTPFHTAVKFGQKNKFKAMWNLCGELGISTDSVLFNETDLGENITHIAAKSNRSDDCFAYLMNLLKCEPGKLMALITKKNIHGHTPFGIANILNKEIKLDVLHTILGELYVDDV